MGNPKTRQKALRAQERREALIDKLGRVCALEGYDCAGRLQIDHIDGRDWDVTMKSQMGRVRIYEREFLKGLLQVLCSYHNKRKQ